MCMNIHVYLSDTLLSIKHEAVPISLAVLFLEYWPILYELCCKCDVTLLTEEVLIPDA